MQLSMEQYRHWYKMCGMFIVWRNLDVTFVKQLKVFSKYVQHLYIMITKSRIDTDQTIDYTRFKTLCIKVFLKKTCVTTELESLRMHTYRPPGYPGCASQLYVTWFTLLSFWWQPLGSEFLCYFEYMRKP